MSWVIDPNSGDYVMESGSPTDSNDLKYPAYNRLKVQRGQWLYAPNDQYGSDYYLVKKRFNGSSLGNLRDIGERALQPIVDDKRAISVQVNYDSQPQQSRNNSALTVILIDAQGELEQLNLPQIGV